MEQTNDKMREELYAKLNDDFNSFIDKLIKGGRETIVNSIEELTIKYDMMLEFEYFFPVEDDNLKAVLDKEHPLEFLYSEWNKSEEYKSDDIHWAIAEIAQAEAERKAETQNKGVKTMTNVDALYYKMQNEYDALIENIKTKSPKEIVEAAYEITYKQDILCLFEDKDCTIISEEQARALLSEKNPLDALYEGWLDTDASVMDDLRDSVINASERIADLFSKRNKAAISHDGR